MKSADTLIIGGGIAGLAAAWTLHQRGTDVVVLESQDRSGGLVRTIRDGPYLLEAGPNAFLGNAESLLQLAAAVGLERETITPPAEAAHRFIYFRGRLHLVPRGPGSFVSTRLLTFGGKLRLLREYWVPPRAIADESVAAFVRRRLGSEVVDRLIDPLVAGIFAGDPDRLSIDAAFPKMTALEREHGGILRGALRSKRGWQARGVQSFRAGMGALPNALAHQLGARIVPRTFVTSVRRDSEGWFVVENRPSPASPSLLPAGRHGEGRGLREGEPWHARNVILATPAYVAAALLKDLVPVAETPLRTILYAPVVVAHVAMAQRDCPRAFTGFGFLVPRRAAVRCLGALWNSACFADRAPPDTFLMTLFYGGMRDPEVIGVSDTALHQIIADDLRATMGIRADPLHYRCVRHRAAIPQYTIGHMERIATLQHAIAAIPGLSITGNYLTGTSVNDTIVHATATAQRL